MKIMLNGLGFFVLMIAPMILIAVSQKILKGQIIGQADAITENLHALRSKATHYPDMPRLEWGMRHIADNLDPVTAAVTTMRSDLADSATTDSSRPSGVPAWFWPGMIIWLLTTLAWFAWQARSIGRDQSV